MTKMREAINRTNAKNLAAFYEMAQDEQTRQEALKAYEELVEKLGYDPLG